MKSIIKLFVLLSCIGSTLSLSAAQITTDYDHHADFSQYKTYSWLKVQAGDQLWEERIQRDVDSQLAAKGWTRVDSGGSASISAFESTKDEETLETFYDGLGGGGWGWRGFGGNFGVFGESTTTTDTTHIGTLVVDIFDTQNHKLLWRGKQSDALSSNPEKNEKKLSNDLHKMFNKFPPK